MPGRGPAGVTPPYFAYSAQRGMRRVHLDVRHPDGRDAFLALAAGADVMVESFRPGVVDRLGIGYEDVRAVNAGIVYCSTSGYGQDGPRSAMGRTRPQLPGRLRLPGLERSPGRRRAPGPGGDHRRCRRRRHARGPGHRRRSVRPRHLTGEGTFLDVSVADGVLWLMSLAVDEHLATGAEPGPGHDVLTGRYACYDTYRAADGRWLAVAAIEAKFFANLCRALGCEEWTDHQYDDDAQNQVRAAFTAAFARHDRDAWVARLSGADTCVAPVQAVSEIAHDPQFAHRGAVVAASDADGRSFCQLGAVLAGMSPLPTPVIVRDPAATDTDELLEGAGIDPAHIAELRTEGVVA